MQSSIIFQTSNTTFNHENTTFTSEFCMIAAVSMHKHSGKYVTALWPGMQHHQELGNSMSCNVFHKVVLPPSLNIGCMGSMQAQI